jgi:FHA domain
MDLKLKILQGKNAGQEVAITGEKFLIGRAEDCHLRPGSEMISRHHCVIVVDQAYVAIRDFGSKNGTYVNNERVVGECELKSGDQLRVGPLEFEITLLQGELGGKKKPPVLNAKEAAERTAAGQPEEQDVSQWLSEPPSQPPASLVDSQCIAALDTQSIKLSETDQITITRTETLDDATVPSHPVAHAAQSHAAQPHVAQPAATQTTVIQPAASRPAPHVQQHAPHAAAAKVTPAPAPQAAVKPAAPPAHVPKLAIPSTFQMPEPEAPVEAKGPADKKKTFGKLPVQPKRPEDTRSAASDLLDRLRKRR